ncbi:host cell division inhibitor Icd-like protein [Sodalis ligni]|uniref:host cell division inhibitor Icd-like protein n=1 Tax=Sodalis ligni TaxID=2697027 RepID=UPI001BDDD42A|nr:host cell division inhibitor Icd-like protein [Sodalis ligni]QWA12771.1 host cell division inhibitor Icd-like protein [Sodalis ligni]
MAAAQPAQIRPKFNYRFRALARTDHNTKLCGLSIEATSEREARLILAPHYILSFAGRLPVPEAYHA